MNNSPVVPLQSGKNRINHPRFGIETDFQSARGTSLYAYHYFFIRKREIIKMQRYHAANNDVNSKICTHIHVQLYLDLYLNYLNFIKKV